MVVHAPPVAAAAPTPTAHAGNATVGSAPQLSAGRTHTCALSATGVVVCWGANAHGQLGDGTTESSLRPGRPVEFADGFVPVSIAAGHSHTCALSGDGRVVCWGLGSSGQLGVDLGDERVRLQPSTEVALPDGALAVSIAAGGAHTCAVLVTGWAACWGSDTAGQLGGGNAWSSDAGAVETDDDARAAGAHDPVVVDLPDGAVVRLAAGALHTCALSDVGTVYCWGRNTDGQLGIGRSGPGAGLDAPADAVVMPGGATAIAVAAGVTHTCAVLQTGEITCWGGNAGGQLGDGTRGRDAGTDRPVGPVGLPPGSAAVEVVAGVRHTCALAADGTVTCWGQTASLWPADDDPPPAGLDHLVPGPALSLPAGTSVRGLVSGTTHACALLGNGDATCWGANAAGQLGDGTTESTSEPVARLRVGGSFAPVAMGLGASHTCVVSAAGDVRCWGSNEHGQLGGSPGTDAVAPRTPVRLPTAALTVSAGARHTCAVTADGSVACWGDDAGGQLGPARVPSASDDTEAAVEEQPGVDADAPGIRIVDLPVPAVAVAAGAQRSCAVLQTREVACWGGLGDDALGDDADARAVVVLDLPERSGAVTVSTDDDHTCALLSTGGVACWSHRLTTEDADEDAGEGADEGAGDGAGEGDGPGGAGLASRAPVLLDLAPATGVALDGSTVCARHGDGTTTCVSIDDDSEPAVSPSPVEPGPIRALALGDGRTCSVSDAAALMCRETAGGPLAELDVPGARAVTSVALGSGHGCVLLAGGAMACWGANEVGQIGDGTLDDRDTLVLVGHPGPPDGVSARAVGSTVVVTWEPPADDGFAPVMGYDVELSDDDGATWESLGRTEVRQLTVLEPSSEAVYRVRVAAVNDVGAGPAVASEAVVVTAGATTTTTTTTATTSATTTTAAPTATTAAPPITEPASPTAPPSVTDPAPGPDGPAPTTTLAGVLTTTSVPAVGESLPAATTVPDPAPESPGTDPAPLRPVVAVDASVVSRGDAVTVRGAGFTPGGRVTLSYNPIIGTANVDPAGRFVLAWETAGAPTGTHSLTATDGVATATTTVTVVDAGSGTRWLAVVFAVGLVLAGATALGGVGWRARRRRTTVGR